MSKFKSSIHLSFFLPPPASLRLTCGFKPAPGVVGWVTLRLALVLRTCLRPRFPARCALGAERGQRRGHRLRPSQGFPG